MLFIALSVPAVRVLTPPATIVHPTVKALGQQELMVALAKRALQSTPSTPDDSYIPHTPPANVEAWTQDSQTW